MAIPDIRNFDVPVGPLRDKLTHTVGTADFEIPQGFICLVNGAGTIVYRTVGGDADQTETITGTDPIIIGVGNHPVLLSAVRGSAGGTTYSEFQAGRL